MVGPLYGLAKAQPVVWHRHGRAPPVRLALRSNQLLSGDVEPLLRRLGAIIGTGALALGSVSPASAATAYRSATLQPCPHLNPVLAIPSTMHRVGSSRPCRYPVRRRSSAFIRSVPRS